MKPIFIGLVMACTTLASAIAGGKTLVETKHGFLGVHLDSHKTEASEARGVVVDRVVEGSAAEKFGIQAGDTILSIDGHEVNSAHELITLLTEYRPQEQIAVTLQRDGATQDLQVELGEKIKKRVHTRKWVEYMDGDRAWIGIRMGDLNPQMSAFFKVDGGILVEWVEEGSPAQVAGLKAGDIILRWENKAVTGTGDIYAQLAKASAGDAVLFTVNRGGEVLELTVGLGALKDKPDWKGHPNFNFEFNFDPNFNAVIRERLNESGKKLEHYEFREQLEGALEEQIENLERHLEKLREKLEENERSQ
jgi:serine protease Do